MACRAALPLGASVMPWRIALALLRSPLILLYALLCLALSAIGLIGAYLLLTLGLETFTDPVVVWLMAGFGLLVLSFVGTYGPGPWR